MGDYTALVDSYERDNFPPFEQWPDLINLDRLGYPEWLNCPDRRVGRDGPMMSSPAG